LPTFITFANFQLPHQKLKNSEIQKIQSLHKFSLSIQKAHKKTRDNLTQEKQIQQHQIEVEKLNPFRVQILNFETIAYDSETLKYLKSQDLKQKGDKI
jgi:hypothetical protein